MCICDPSNKFVESVSDGDCQNVLRIRLKVKAGLNSVTYSIKNTGIGSICGDFNICSKLFGHISVKNDLLLSGESRVHVHQGDAIPHERARAFINICDKTYLASNLWDQILALGIAPASANHAMSFVAGNLVLITTIANKQNATLVMKGATVKLKYNSLINASRFNGFYGLGLKEYEMMDDGILFYIPDLAPGESYTFRPTFLVRENITPFSDVGIEHEYLFKQNQLESWDLQPWATLRLSE